MEEVIGTPRTGIIGGDGNQTSASSRTTSGLNDWSMFSSWNIMKLDLNPQFCFCKFKS